MANLGATRATHANVKALAERILANRQKELGELKQFMTSVAEDWQPADKQSLKTMPVANLEKASGAAFDRLFVDMMIEHERDAITLTRTAKLVMPTVQGFAQRSMQQQTAELEQLQKIK